MAIYGDEPWEFKDPASPQNAAGQSSTTSAPRGATADANPQKQKAFVESIRSGKFHNEAAEGAESALSAILGRTAAYSGTVVNWEEILRSQEAWDAKIDLNKFA